MANRLREGEEQVRIHVWIYARDRDRLDALYGKTTGPSKVIRLVLRKFLDGLEARALAQRNSPIAKLVSSAETPTEEEIDNAV